MGADLADMQLISKFIKGIRFCYVLLIFLVNIHGLFFLKVKKRTAITNAFQNRTDESGHNPE